MASGVLGDIGTLPGRGDTFRRGRDAFGVAPCEKRSVETHPRDAETALDPGPPGARAVLDRARGVPGQVLAEPGKSTPARGAELP